MRNPFESSTVRIEEEISDEDLGIPPLSEGDRVAAELAEQLRRAQERRQEEQREESAAASGHSAQGSYQTGNVPVPPPGLGGGSEGLVNTLIMMLQAQMQSQQQQTQQMFQLMSERLARVEKSAPTSSSHGGSGGAASSSSSSFPAEGKMPFGVEIPKVPFKEWKSRHAEILGWHTWLELFLSWLNLISDSYPSECRYAMQEAGSIHESKIPTSMAPRAHRLLSYLKQAISGWHRAESLVAHYVATVPQGSAHGYEALRKLNLEFGLQSRAEALSIREAVLGFQCREHRLMDVIRAVDVRVQQYTMILRAGFADPKMQGTTQDLAIPEADLVLLLLKQLPPHVVLHVQLHGKADTYANLCNTVKNYDLNTRLLDISKVNAFSDNQYQKGKGKEKGKFKGKDAEEGKGKNAKGKGKDKGKVKKKGKGGSKDREPSQESRKSQQDTPRKLGPCYLCGKDGHLKKDCPSKKKVNVVFTEEPEAQPTESEIYGVLTTSSTSTEGQHVVSQTSFDNSCGSQRRERVFSIHGAVEWLVDSGATSHIVALQHVDQFETVREYQGSVELKAANGAAIEVHKVVDLAVPMLCVPAGAQDVGRNRRAVQRIVLTHVIVADIDFNVLSPYVLCKHQWTVSLGQQNVDSFLRVRGKRFPLEMFDRGWWLISQDRFEAQNDGTPKGSPKQGRKPAPADWPKATKASDDMEIDQVSSGHKGILRKDVKAMSDSRPADVGALAQKPVLKKPSDSVPQHHLQTQRLESSGLTFLLRGLSGEPCYACQDPVCSGGVAGTGGQELIFDDMSVNDCLSELGFSDAASYVTVEEFQECAEWFEIGSEAGYDVGDPKEWLFETDEDQPLPPLDHEFTDEEGVPDFEFSDDLELSDQPLYDHLSQGHQPFLSSCPSCSRSSGRIPARKVQHKKGPYEVALDITFIGTLKILVAVVFCTSMMGAFCMTGEVDRDARMLNGWFKEFGLSGQVAEVTLDGERKLEGLVRTTMKLENHTLSQIVLKPTPPGRSQANGKVERFHGLLKNAFGANLMHVESQVRRRIPLESPLVPFLVPYVARTYNVHHVPTKSFTTAVEKLKNRSGAKRLKTFPFGVTLLAKPTSVSASHALESLCQVTYLGPVTSFGGGLWGVLTGDSKVGLVDEEAVKVRRFQVAKMVFPLKWDIDHLLVGPVEALPEAFENPKGPTYVIPTEFEEIHIPPSGPPRAWLDVHGPTAGCTACDQWKETGTARSRAHGKKCKQRYKEFLEDLQRQKQESQDRPSFDTSSSGSGQDSAEGLPVPILPVDPSIHPTGGKRFDRKQPPVVPSGVDVHDVPTPVGVQLEIEVPGADDNMSDGYSLPSPMSVDGDPFRDVDMSEMDAPPPVEEPMELDVLIKQMLDENIERFLGMEQSFAGGDWFETKVCGIDVWQQVPKHPRCESTGVALEIDALIDAIQKEFDQLTELQVGVGIDELTLNNRAKELGVRIIPCRWVLTMKGDGRTRARLVCKDFKHLGQSALKEGHYSPTSTIESLRAVLAVTETEIRWRCGEDWMICSLDVSTAFMFAALRKNERILVSFPNSTQARPQGGRIGLDLKKAMNGLRKAPLLWYLEIRDALLSIGFAQTVDPSIFRRIDSKKRLQLILLYVDDTIMIGSTKACLEVISELQARYTIKETGRMIGTEKGQLEFLGRLITREVKGGPLLMGVGDLYYDDIQTASGLSLSTAQKVPDLAKFVQDEHEKVWLDKRKAEIFRTVLGKLSWLSISLPSIMFCTSWLSSYQASPTERAFQAMVAVLKYVRSQKGVRQCFPSPSVDLGSNNARLIIATVDSSWSLRSTMGGYLHYRSCMLKAWSRRIPIPCLSSAESELYALIEGLKESLGAAILIETMVEGMPVRDALGFFERETGTYKIVLRTDSQAAQHISSMHGLLRRVRHLELRIAVLQYYTSNERCQVEFVPGSRNGSDALTKPGDVVHQNLLMEETGLKHSSETQQVDVLVSELMQLLSVMSSQNSRRVREAVGMMVRKLLSACDLTDRSRLLYESVLHFSEDGAARASASSSHGMQEFEAGVCECASKQSVACPRSLEVSRKRVVRFLETPEIRLIPSRALPKRWNKVLKRYPHLECFRESLALAVAGCQVFVEMCCKENSNFAHLFQKKAVAYFGITAEVDLSNHGTQFMIRSLVGSSSKVVALWVATPCASGSPLRHATLQQNAVNSETWQEQFRLHRCLWRSIGKTLKDIPKRMYLLIQEWPLGNSFWHDSVYIKVSMRLEISSHVPVRRCCMDGIHKNWLLGCNHDFFEKEARKFIPVCQCGSYQTVPWEGSGYYSLPVVQFFWKLVCGCLAKLSQEVKVVWDFDVEQETEARVSFLHSNVQTAVCILADEETQCLTYGCLCSCDCAEAATKDVTPRNKTSRKS